MSENGRMDITEFLEARIAEDENAARGAGSHTWGDVFARDNYGSLLIQPARVLAECAAKRALIADHAEFVGAVEYLSAALPGDLNRDPSAPWRTSTFRRLAAVYANHPDYQPEWANNTA